MTSPSREFVFDFISWKLPLGLNLVLLQLFCCQTASQLEGAWLPGFHSPRVTSMRIMPYQEMVEHVFDELRVNPDYAGFRRCPEHSSEDERRYLLPSPDCLTLCTLSMVSILCAPRKSFELSRQIMESMSGGQEMDTTNCMILVFPFGPSWTTPPQNGY